MVRPLFHFRPLRPATLGVVLAACLVAGCARTSDRAGDGAAAAGFAPRGAGGGDTSTVDAVAVLPGSGAADAFMTFLAPSVDAPVIARSDGIVSEVRAREGQRVAKGQVLARLDDDEQRLEVDYMTALSQQADAERARAERGAQEQWISLQILDAARAKARAAKADLDLAKLALERRTLLAPVSGVVWQVRAVAHRPVKTADVLFRVTDPSRLEAELFLPAALKGQVHVGDVARLVPQGGSAAPIAARVSAASPIVDPATGRFRVVFATTKAPATLAGQPVRVELGLGRAKPGATGSAAGAEGPAATGGAAVSGGAVLPAAAYLERTGDGLFAVRVDHGLARRVPVELGALRADGYEVLSGLAPGDLVLADGADVPKEGAPVNARLHSATRPAE